MDVDHEIKGYFPLRVALVTVHLEAASHLVKRGAGIKIKSHREAIDKVLMGIVFKSPELILFQNDLKERQKAWLEQQELSLSVGNGATNVDQDSALDLKIKGKVL